MKICPKCGTENRDAAAACRKCKTHIGEVLPVGEETQKLIETRERIKSLILTTGFEVEGRPIKEYLGIVTSEVVMGTGPVVEFLGGLADLFGTRSSGFEQKLEQAKEASLEKLKGKAVTLGADAVIGLDIDYMEIGANMLMVVANGTAVKLSAP